MHNQISTTAIVRRWKIEGMYRGPFWRSSRSYFRIPFCCCILKEVAYPRHAKTRTKSHFAVMWYVTLPYVMPFRVADLILREDLSSFRSSWWAVRKNHLIVIHTKKKIDWRRNSPFIIFLIVSYVRRLKFLK